MQNGDSVFLDCDSQVQADGLHLVGFEVDRELVVLLK